MLDPPSRPAPLDRIVVVTAMTGDEHSDTARLVERHILPLFRKYAVRFVQVGRAGRTAREDTPHHVILDDSRSPTTLHVDGVYKLSDELDEAGTAVQRSGPRHCSVHAKGEVLDPAIAEVTGGERFTHYIGFTVEEGSRVEKDRCYANSTRCSAYPLVEWGWTRADAEAFIKEHTGVDWPKSCCTFCPFALSSKAKRVAAAERLDAEPDDRRATAGLWMEAIATALNPRQPLIKGGLLHVIEEHAPAVVRRMEARFEDVEAWGLYEVRRAWLSSQRVVRSIRLVQTGSRAALERRVAGAERTAYGLAVKVVSDRPAEHGREHRYAVVPAVVQPKEHRHFRIWWRRLIELDAIGAAPDDVDYAARCLAALRERWPRRVPSLDDAVAALGGAYLRAEITAARKAARAERSSTSTKPAPRASTTAAAERSSTSTKPAPRASTTAAAERSSSTKPAPTTAAAEGFDRAHYFASGSNHAGEVRGFAAAGWNVGVRSTASPSGSSSNSKPSPAPARRCSPTAARSAKSRSSTGGPR
ncbi:MAG: hypothetical protein R3F65_23760 [bacterium]